MDNRENKKTSYQDAGVDIEKGNELIRRLKETIDNTHRKGVIGGLGGFLGPVIFGYLLKGTGIWTTTWMFLALLAATSLAWMHFSIQRMRDERAG